MNYLVVFWEVFSKIGLADPCFGQGLGSQNGLKMGWLLGQFKICDFQYDKAILVYFMVF